MLSFIFLLIAGATAFNNPRGVDIWCGKAYRPTNASFNPGGWFEEPTVSSVPLLDFRIRPRMTLYLESDSVGSFLVDASVSDQIGEPLYTASNVSSSTKEKLHYTITVGNSSVVKVNATTLELGTSDNEVHFDPHEIPVSPTPYKVTIHGSLHGQNFTANTELLRLPKTKGSATRLDNLYGGLSVQKPNSTTWDLMFPYTYYVQWTLYWNESVSTLDDFAARGYNVIHIVPTGDLGSTPFPWDVFEPYLQRADELGLYFQYDVRWEFANLTTMIDQVTRLREHPSILLWYTGDEPDGKSNPLNSTEIAYSTIRALDLYHPVSMALNCANFYYREYAAGAEIILSDVYPVSTNTSWSTVYETPCNATYGCCGCDDCTGSMADISTRLDSFAHFDDVIGWSKTHWSAPQAFGNETFWSRYPTAAEEVVMALVAVNHGAKGLVMWDFPTTDELLRITDRLAKVVTDTEVVEFLLGAELVPLDSLRADLDAAAWIAADGRLLISVINLGYGDIKGAVGIKIPVGDHITKTLWGDIDWRIADGIIETESEIPGLGVSLLMAR
ncbi:hypothetical protein AAFC00_001551 [Neodothiora populina]|uniref:Glycoside hydrolase subgroup catalytic core n=1 Tax=Neodothiora populina TaxID=2781224 RepID=A0ABR3PQB8_9PEZI